MSIERKLIGRRIRAIRKRKKLSQAQLAERANLTPSFLSCIETGKRGINLEAFVDIANALEVSADYILTDSIKHNVETAKQDALDIISDCDDFERRVIIEVVRNLKRCLRENKHLLIRDIKERLSW